MNKEIEKRITLIKTHINSIKTLKKQIMELSPMNNEQFNIFKKELYEQERVLI